MGTTGSVPDRSSRVPVLIATIANSCWSSAARPALGEDQAEGQQQAQDAQQAIDERRIKRQR